jgi:hypothetical protein
MFARLQAVQTPFGRALAHTLTHTLKAMRLRLLSYLAAAAALPLRLRAQTLVVRSIGAVSVLPLDRPSALFTEMPPTLLRVPAALSPAGGCPAVAAGALALYLSTGYVGLCVANVSALAPSSPTGFALATCSVPFSGESWRSWPPAAVPPLTWQSPVPQLPPTAPFTAVPRLSPPPLAVTSPASAEPPATSGAPASKSAQRPMARELVIGLRLMCSTFAG